MPGLKVFGLFIFLIVFSETGAQITEPAWVQAAIPEDPDGKALSEQSSENITHINSDKLNGHLESESLEVVPSWFEKSAEKYSTEVGYDNAAVSENSQPFDSALVENYKDDDILSFDLLSSTDRASYDEGTATKGLTDGFEHHDVINDSATSGDSVAGHGEYANGDESYKFVNHYGSSSDESTDESIFSSSYPDDENDKELFESYDPIDGEWFKQDDATTSSYHHDDALLKRIEELFAKDSSKFPSQTASTEIDNDWERIFSGTTQKVGVIEDESSFNSEAINKSEYENIDALPSYFGTISSDETTISPLDDTIIKSDTDIDTTATASSNTGDQEHDGENISASIDGSISTKLNNDRNDENEEESAEIVTENNWNDDDATKDIETTSRTIWLRPADLDSKTENYISTQIKDDKIEASNESVIRENITVVASQESHTSLSEEFASRISEQINEPTSQRTEDYGIETTTNNEYSIPLVATVKNLDENNFLKKYNNEDDDENVPVEESKEGEFAEESITSTTEKYKVYKTIDYDYSNEKNDTDSVESSTEAVTESLFKPVTSDFMSNTAQETDNGLVTERNVFENYETENQKNEDAISFNEPTTQSVVYVSNTDVVQGQDNSEETIEPTDTTSEYGSETNVNNKNVITTFDGNNKNTSSAAESKDGNEAFPENKPITTEEDNEEISTTFYESNPSDDNLHPNEEEDIIEPTETHIEEYDIEINSNISSTVESKDISEEFPENEPVVSTTEVDNEEVSTAFYEANPSDDNLHRNKKEGIMEPTETLIEEYVTETNVDNSKDISSTVESKDINEEFPENEPIVSTTEADIEEISTVFYETNPNNANLNPNKKEETTESTETHIEEYGTESTVETKDRSEEFSENEPILSTTEADNEEVSTKFYEVNSSNDNLHLNNAEETSEPTEAHIEEYGTESTVETKDRSEEFSDNEPIVSTTEADNEEVSTKFYEANPSNDNLHPNKAEETTEPTETHIEEYDTESTVEIKDRSEEFSENEPIVSTTEADNEVSTKFYEANLSNDNLHPNKAEETTEPTETHIEEYDTESTVEIKDRSEEFSENEPIVSTTEADNEEVSTKFYEANPSNDNLHPNKAEETTEPTDAHNEKYGTESTVEPKDRSEEFLENEPIVSTTEAGSDDDSTPFYEVNSSDNLHSRKKDEKELVENTTIMREESIANFTDSTIETIITTTAIPRETHNDDQFVETNRVTTTSTESNDNILTTIIYNSYNEKKTDVLTGAMKGIEKFSQGELEESTTETYNKETTTISYETSSEEYNYKEKEESEPVESTMSVLIIKEITFNFNDNTTEEIVSTTETDSDAIDNSSNGAEVKKQLQEEEEISIEESTTSISIEEKTVKYFTDGETEVLTTTEMSEKVDNFSEDNLEEIDEPTSQRIGTFTEDDGRDATVNNVSSVADFKGDSKDISTTIKYELIKENSEGKHLLFDSSTKKYSIDKESFNEEGETDFLESTSVSIKEEITSNFIDNSETNTTEEIIFIPEIESEMHSVQTESNEYFSKDVVDVTETADYVTVENSFITTETFTDTRHVTEEIPIETTSSSLDINKNDPYLLPTESNIDYTNTTDDNVMNERVSTTHTISEDHSDADDIVIEDESRGSTQNEENVLVTTEKENTEKINTETTTVLSLQGEKKIDLEITKIFDSVNDNVTKLINDSIKKMSRKIEATPTVNDSFTTIESSDNYSSSISSEESAEEEEPEEEKVKNEVSAVNVSNRWSTFDIPSVRDRNHDYDQSVEDSSVEEYEDSNENKTVTPYMEESEPYIKANVFGNHANVSIKIEIEDDFFHVPSNAHFDDDSDKHILNITWPSSHMQLNNSILLTLKENPELYVIQGAQLNLVEGDDFDIWNENFTVVQENSTFGKTNFVVELEDDARIYFSNLDFLRIAESDSNDVPSIPSAMKIDTKEIGIATGCIAAALFVCATIYFIISRSRKRVVHIEELSKNDIPV